MSSAQERNSVKSTEKAPAPALFELTRARLLLLLRQPEIVFWAFLFPVLLSMVVGLAFSHREAPTSRVLIVEDEGWRALDEALAGAEHLHILRTSDPRETERLFESGAVDVIIRPGTPPGLRYDETRAESLLARLRVREALRGGAERVEQDALTAAEVAEPRTGNRYLDWFVPGLMGLSVMSTSIWAVGFAFVESRQRRLVRRLLVTPMRRAEYLLSHILARLVLLVFEVALLLAFALLILKVPFRGSVVAFLVLCAVGATVFAGIGVLLGSRVRTVEAAAGLINLAMMPMGLASGVFFSYERFPEVLQPIIRALPLAALNDALRAVMLDGLGLAAVLPELALMSLWGIVAFLLGLWIFRWQ